MAQSLTLDAPLIAPWQIADFVRDGTVKLPGLLEPSWIDKLLRAFDDMKSAAFDMSAYYEDAGQPAAPAFSTLVRDENWTTNAEMRNFVFDSPIAEAAAAVIGASRVNIYEDLLIYKAAGSGGPTPWHQDEPQWPVTGTQMASIWLCLEKATLATGALRFVAGSHRGPLYEPYAPASQQAGIEADRHYFTGGILPDVDADPVRYPVISFDTEPGDVVAFHPRVIHGAFGSATDHPRRTFSIRFLGDDVRWQSKASVVLAWLAEVKLRNGDAMDGERFPQIWPSPRSESA